MGDGADHVNCEQTRQLWHDRLDGLADSNVDAEFDAHMSACDACRVWRGQMQQVAGALDALRIETEQIGASPTRDREGVVASIGPHVRPRRRSAAWWALSRIAAGTYVYQNQTSNTLDTKRIVKVGPTIVVPPPLAATVVLTGESAEQYISVRHETSSPNVHVFRLYRVYQRLEAETKTKDS